MRFGFGGRTRGLLGEVGRINNVGEGNITESMMGMRELQRGGVAAALDNMSLRDHSRSRSRSPSPAPSDSSSCTLRDSPPPPPSRSTSAEPEPRQKPQPQPRIQSQAATKYPTPPNSRKVPQHSRFLPRQQTPTPTPAVARKRVRSANEDSDMISAARKRNARFYEYYRGNVEEREDREEGSGIMSDLRDVEVIADRTRRPLFSNNRPTGNNTSRQEPSPRHDPFSSAANSDNFVEEEEAPRNILSINTRTAGNSAGKQGDRTSRAPFIWNRHGGNIADRQESLPVRGLFNNTGNTRDSGNAANLAGQERENARLDALRNNKPAESVADRQEAYPRSAVSNDNTIGGNLAERAVGPPRPAPFQIPPDAAVVDLSDEEVVIRLEEELEREMSQVDHRVNIRASNIPERNAKLLSPYALIQSHKWKNSHLLSGKTVELIDGSFLKIKTVVQNLVTNCVTLRGWKLVRCRSLGIANGILPKKLNELCFIHEVDLDDNRPVLEQSVHEIELDGIVKIRKLICTNKAFDDAENNCRHDKNDVPQNATQKEKELYIEKQGDLVARRCYIARYQNKQERVSQKPDRTITSAIVRSLTEEECSHGKYDAAEDRKFRFRGETMAGGSDRSARSGSPKYTFGDAYCGAGGMTRGAVQAGLKIKWGFDFNSEAGKTWRANFADAQFYEHAVHEFVGLPDPLKWLTVDVLHLSPPCQVFSPVHTRVGQDDERNYASLFGVEATIRKARPRIVTLEQTFGILHWEFNETFNQLIRMFTDVGYDVSWQVARFQEFGLPQSRRRLIIVASCPGETLPAFPAYTYGPTTRKAFKTPAYFLAQVKHDVPNHDPTNPQLNKKNYIPWNDQAISSCIMTSGADGKGHPSGSRGLTNRELAALQGFPNTHIFHGQQIRKQVGNAVPPLVGKIILGAVRRHLERVDGVSFLRERDAVVIE